jgi:hypothetical protein
MIPNPPPTRPGKTGKSRRHQPPAEDGSYPGNGGGVNHGRARIERPGNPQVNHQSCKPICKPDATGRAENGETRKVGRQHARPYTEVSAESGDGVETAETYVVWLITQRRPARPMRERGASHTPDRLVGRDRISSLPTDNRWTPTCASGPRWTHRTLSTRLRIRRPAPEQPGTDEACNPVGHVQDGGIVTRLDMRAGVWRKVWDGNSRVAYTASRRYARERVVVWTGAWTAPREDPSARCALIAVA